MEKRSITLYGPYTALDNGLCSYNWVTVSRVYTRSKDSLIRQLQNNVESWGGFQTELFGYTRFAFLLVS